MLKRISIIVSLLLLVLIFTGVGFYIFITSKPAVEEHYKNGKAVIGDTLNLTSGITQYETAGPETGEVILFIHGSLVPAIAFDNNFYHLAKKGYRVVRFDLYGRGLSARPNLAYTPELYLNQIKELIDGLNLKKPIHLAGSSMGGAFSVLFFEKYPQYVKSVILFDTVTPSSFKTNRDELLSKISTRITKLADRVFNGGTPDTLKGLYERASEQLKYEGVGRSMISALSYLKDINLTSAFASLNDSKIPVLLFWGESDDVIPFSESLVVQELLDKVEFHRVKEATHFPHYEQPQVVNPLIVNFLLRT
jgi:pimeloyl-ACP methyl ester carboxylesterase